VNAEVPFQLPYRKGTLLRYGTPAAPSPTISLCGKGIRRWLRPPYTTFP
jgi:hypothetical protein